ncbi:MAG: MMPL family transporter, partial [Pseudomonadales bacterium]|nr:MMPL family transporter [Pseudomonadales bacterium]
MNHITAFYQKVILAHPLSVLIILAILGGFMGFAVPSTKLDASADSLTLEHDESIDYFRENITRYGTGDFLVITFTPEKDIFSDESLAILGQLKNELLQLETVASVNSILDLPLLDSPRISLSELSKAPRTLLSPSTDRALARKEFVNSPIYRNMVLSDDGLTTALLVNLKLDKKYYELVGERDALRLKKQQQGLTEDEEQLLQSVSQEFLDYRTAMQERSAQEIKNIRNIMAKYKNHASMFLGGVSMITADMIEFIRSDLLVFGSGVLLFIVLMLAIIFRQLRWIVLPLLSCCLSAVLMLGYLAWIDWRLTVISSNFVALLLIITLSMTIHLVVRYRELVAEMPGASQQELVWQMVSFMVLPCLYTILTTMVAFVSLVVSDIRPVIDFGWMMTMGLTVAFITVFLVIPCALLLMSPSRADNSVDVTRRLTLSLAVFAEKRGNTVLLVSVMLALLSVWGISRLKVENRFIDYFDESTEIYQGMQLIDQKLGGTTPLDIILDVKGGGDATRATSVNGSDPFSIEPANRDTAFSNDSFDDQEFADDEFADGFTDNGFDDAPFAAAESNSQLDTYWFTQAGLDDISALHQYIDSLSVTGKVSSLAMTYDVAKEMSNGRLNDFELKFLYKMLPEDIRKVLIYPYLSVEDNQTRISVRVRESDPSLRRGELIESIRHFAENEMGYAPGQIHFTNMIVLYNNMLNSLFRSQILTLGAVFVGIMLMFFVLFRSFYLSVIAIIPNILAAALVMGLMGIFNIALDMMTITIAAIVIGIGVDHSIHYIHRFKREFAVDQNYLAAMHRS